MRPTGTPQELERRRLRALSLVEEGFTESEVAKRVGADPRSVRRWKAAVRKYGEEGVRARPVPGRPAKLDARQKQRLEVLLLKGPIAAGFDTDLWTCRRVTELIKQRFGVEYHVDHIGRLLHDLGWSPQKPARRAVERDEVEIRRWVREDWPRVKKTPASGARRSSS